MSQDFLYCNYTSSSVTTQMNKQQYVINLRRIFLRCNNNPSQIEISWFSEGKPKAAKMQAHCRGYQNLL
jgi:hypothetical protein